MADGSDRNTVPDRWTGTGAAYGMWMDMALDPRIAKWAEPGASTVAGSGYPAAYEGCAVMAVKVYLGGAPAARSEMTYEEADAFSVTAGGFLFIQRQHSGEQKDLAVFAPTAWLNAEVVREPASGSQ